MVFVRLLLINLDLTNSLHLNLQFSMDPNWHVAAGEESTELVAQSRRQILLEAVYPSYSAIPSRFSLLPLSLSLW